MQKDSTLLNKMVKKTVVGLSGGMDSTTLLGFLLDQGHEVHCCIFTYGSKHNQYENKAAHDVVEFYKEKGFPVFAYDFNLEATFAPFKSNLLKTGGEIPEGHYEDASMSLTVVPGRNMIFAAIMAGLAESIGAESVALGVHNGDHAIYPDCRAEFIKALDLAVYLGSDRKVEVLTPLVGENKESILLLGSSCFVPYELTRTCYKDQPVSCGKCGSCQERLEAFKNLNKIDPIPYE